MKNKLGFTLIELMITMAIMAIIVALTGPVYTRLLGGVKEETVSSEVQLDLINGQELIRLDIEHVGVGIARNEAAPTVPLIWNNGTKTLELRSTLNNTNQTTMGWALIDCTAPGLVKDNYITNNKATAGLTTMVLLRGRDSAGGLKAFGGLTTATNYNTYACPAGSIPEIYSAYPYDPPTPLNAADNFCGNANLYGDSSWCTRISYQLSTVHPAPTSKAACAQGTFDLLRAVGNGSGTPVVNCVADFSVRADVDLDGTGSISPTEKDIDISDATVVTPPNFASDQMDTITGINILVLVQAGQRDNDLSSNPNTTISGVTLSLAGVPASNNYSWKVIKISGKPMSWK